MEQWAEAGWEGRPRASSIYQSFLGIHGKIECQMASQAVRGRYGTRNRGGPERAGATHQGHRRLRLGLLSRLLLALTMRSTLSRARPRSSWEPGPAGKGHQPEGAAAPAASSATELPASPGLTGSMGPHMPLSSRHFINVDMPFTPAIKALAVPLSRQMLEKESKEKQPLKDPTGKNFLVPIQSLKHATPVTVGECKPFQNLC